jgi:triosephosphate isomerase
MVNKKLLVGNWKMNPETIVEARKTLLKIKTKAGKLQNVHTVICPPAVFLGDLTRNLKGKRCVLGAQDCHYEVSGSHTGENSPRQIRSLKAKYVIIGHSERRALGEGDEEISKKVRSALGEDLTVILCVGEEKRDKDGNYLRVIQKQLLTDLSKIAKNDLSRIVVAYEPIWAIGKNALRPAKPSDVFEMKIFVKRVLTDAFGKDYANQTLFLYGGSADEKNAEDFLGEGQADGLLVGRASLSDLKFCKMLEVAEEISSQKKG